MSQVVCNSFDVVMRGPERTLIHPPLGLIFDDDTTPGDGLLLTVWKTPGLDLRFITTDKGREKTVTYAPALGWWTPGDECHLVPPAHEGYERRWAKVLDANGGHVLIRIRCVKVPGEYAEALFSEGH